MSVNANILALNALSETETSPMTRDSLDAMLKQAFFCALEDEGRDGYLITFDQDAAYDSVNFHWFKQRYPRFIYIDRVVVAESARGRGIARRFYEGLFAHARSSGHTLVTCEINLVPANPGSIAFHRALGFSEVGQAQRGADKTVSYQHMRL